MIRIRRSFALCSCIQASGNKTVSIAKRYKGLSGKKLCSSFSVFRIPAGINGRASSLSVQQRDLIVFKGLQRRKPAMKAIRFSENHEASLSWFRIAPHRRSFSRCVWFINSFKLQQKDVSWRAPPHIFLFISSRTYPDIPLCFPFGKSQTTEN